jgi:hypothetical protein
VFKRKPKSDKSAKAAKPAKAKATRAPKARPAKKVRATSLGPVKKQPTDIYTVMLIISMVAVPSACILLLLELNRVGSYPWWIAG